MKRFVWLLCLASCARPAFVTDVLRPCPTSGRGAMEGDVCFVVTPAETGLASDGKNATVDQYALRPVSGARGQLMIFFNGSGGSPRAGTGTASGSWYGAARAAGFHVFAVSYSSDESIGSLCRMNDACFEPTRTAMLVGGKPTGSVISVRADEAAEARVLAALRLLVSLDPDGGWGAFVGDDGVRWENVVAAGHSQGGGHAALVGKRRPVARVIMLASPCDQSGGAAASWLRRSSEFQTPADRFFGLGVDGDQVCPAFATNWAALEVPASAQRRGSTCTGEDAHSAPLRCAAESSWSELLK